MCAAANTLGAWLERFVGRYATLRCQSVTTIERYRSLAQYICSPRTAALAAVAGTPIAKLKHPALEEAFVSLLAAPAKRHAHLSARTVRHVGALVHVALQKACRLDLIDTNPMDRVELPRADRRDARWLTTSEIHALRDQCRGDWTLPFVDLALGTGARRGELLALEWQDLDVERRKLTIARSLINTATGIQVKEPKGGRGRVIAMPRVSLAALRDLCGGHLMFPDDDRGYRSPVLVSQAIGRRLRAAGIRGASLHSMRHTHASVLLSRGVPLPAVSVRLGHADPNVTARIYAHAIPADDVRAAAEWDALFE